MLDKELSDAIRDIGVAFERRKVGHALIGGVAVGFRSRPRATKDADFIVHAPALSLPGLLQDLVESGFAIDVMDFLRRWPSDRFIVFFRGRVRIDWMQPILPIYNTVMKSAKIETWNDSPLRVATAEGLILTKLLSFRPQDIADMETLLVAAGADLDVAMIRQEWAAFAATEPDRTAWLDGAITRLGPQPPSGT